MRREGESCFNSSIFQHPGSAELRHGAYAGGEAEGGPETRGAAVHHETADDYHGIVARLCSHHRVITCKDHIQWILQRSDGERHGRARWTGAGYFLTREALIGASRAFCTRADPAALAALVLLPEYFGRAGG